MSILSRFNPKTNDFYFIIGEDGLVVVYFVDGAIKSRAFHTQPDMEETKEMRKWLIGDPDARISIFIDTLDQSYTQRALPVVGFWGAQKLAANRLQKDFSKQQLKAALSVGRLPTGRRDHVYIFASASHEGIVQNWLKFLLPFPNIIKGIYLLPIELYSVVEVLKADHKNHPALKIDAKQQKNPQDDSELGHWELLLVNNKSGGYRQVAYCNRTIIFTRLLSSSGNTEDDVMAGNIEQEIVSSVEYLRRIAVVDVRKIDLYLIIPDGIKQYLRTNRLGVTNAQIYNPYQLAQHLGTVDPLTKAKDRFTDPAVLAACYLHKKRLATMHIQETRRVMIMVNYISAGIFASYASVPMFGILALWQLMGVAQGVNNLSDLRQQSAVLKSQLATRTQAHDASKNQYGKNANVEKIKEMTSIFADITALNVNPLISIYKLAAISPSTVKIKDVKWKYLSTKSTAKPAKSAAAPELAGRRTNPKVVHSNSLSTEQAPPKTADAKSKAAPLFSYTGNFDITFNNPTENYAQLVDEYTDYTKQVTSAFADTSITVSNLPQNFSFSETQGLLKLTVTIKYPKDEPKQEKKIKL